MKIAIIEDDVNLRRSLQIALSSKKKYKIEAYKSAVEALNKLDDDVDLLIVDINMPKMDGVTFLKKLNGKYDAIVITGNATLLLAIEALRIGARDFIRKPFEISELEKSITNIQKANNKLSTKKKAKNKKVQDFTATSKALDKTIKITNKVAPTDATVMLRGESGVGKEVFANYIHNNSSRSGEAMIAINMASIPENLLESELFGYEKGAFTDAKETRMGKFELANNGTLFLDEIGEMPISLQAKILRAIQEKEIQRVGSSKTIKINIRIISATNASLDEKIKNKEFREDLYYRLNTITINIPPLRDREEEIIPLCESIIKQTTDDYNLGEKTLSQQAKEDILKYDWPGNIRELKSKMEMATIISDNKEITNSDIFNT